MNGAFRFPAGISPKRAFSVLEILVACTVLAVLVGILASAFSGFASLVSSSGGRLEANNQVRTVFDRLAFDLSARVRSDDVKIDFRKDAAVSSAGNSNNDSLAVLVDARSTAADSRFARVGYEIGRSVDAASGISGNALLRSAVPFLWTDDLLNVAPTGAVGWQVLGDGIFRMEIGFLKTDGRVVASPPTEEEIAAIIVATAALDERTRAKMNEAEIAALAQALPNGMDGRLPMEGWSVENLASLSRPAAQAVRFQQRYFYLR